jgi:hypothetical protein
MRHANRAIALPLVLLSSMIVLGIILLGLQLSSQNILFIAGVHRRNVAQAAAEGGVYKAMARLESDGAFQGTFTEPLGDAAIEVAVDNQLAGAGYAVIRSTGKSGRFSKTVEARIEFSALSFETIGSEGQIIGRGPNYANGVHSLRNPLTEAVGVHSNSNIPGAIRLVDASDRFKIGGIASAVGTIAPGIDAVEKNENEPSRNFIDLDRDELLAGTFNNGTLPSNGQLSSNLRVTGEVEFHQELVLSNDAVLHLTGDAVFHEGITGKGTVVSDGDLYVRGGENIHLDNDSGVLLYSEQNIHLVHPQATNDGQGEFVSTVDPVGDYFAQMPESAGYYLSQTLPVDAPNGIAFFNWYKSQSVSPSSSFSDWRNGDGTEINPGLPPDVKSWLDASVQINQELNQWAQGG